MVDQFKCEYCGAVTREDEYNKGQYYKGLKKQGICEMCAKAVKDGSQKTMVAKDNQKIIGKNIIVKLLSSYGYSKKDPHGTVLVEEWHPSENPEKRIHTAQYGKREDAERHANTISGFLTDLHKAGYIIIDAKKVTRVTYKT